ncbi:mCG146128, partial [Mus musculus]
ESPGEDEPFQALRAARRAAKLLDKDCWQIRKGCAGDEEVTPLSMDQTVFESLRGAPRGCAALETTLLSATSPALHLPAFYSASHHDEN